MPIFRYTAIDKNDQRVAGNVEAATSEDAVAQLEADGLRVGTIEPFEVDAAEDAGKSLSHDEAIEITGRIADVVTAQLPLASGLRAMSEEVPSRKLRRFLGDVSRRIEAGESLESIFQEPGAHLPRNLGGLIQAGIQTDQLGMLLEQFLDHERESLDRRRQTLLALAYPAVLVVIAGIILFCMSLLIVPGFKRIFADFGVVLPGITLFAFLLTDFVLAFGMWILPLLVLLGVIAWAVVRQGIGRRFCRRLIWLVPLFGPLVRYSALASFCHYLAMLVDHRVQLPKALRLAGLAANDAVLAAAGQELSARVEEGEPIEDAVSPLGEFPSELLHVFRWANQPAAFRDALYAARQTFDIRARYQSTLIANICEPVAVLGTAMCVGFVVIALFMPLVRLLNDLS
jgi:type II secretory pathway component PulF